MNALWLLLHLLAFVLWMGGAFASMIAGIRGRQEERSVQAAVTRIQAAIGRRLIIPGALLTVITGFLMTIRLMGGEIPPGLWLMVMQGAGLLAAGLTLFISVPITARLSRLDPVGPTAGLFDAFRKRQAMVGSISGTLGLIALVAGVLNRS